MNHNEDMIKDLEKEHLKFTSLIVGGTITISGLYFGLLFTYLSSIGF